MEMFEKHMAKNYPRAERNSMCWEDQERGWRAALERALKAGQDAGLENFIPVSWVNKELEETE